MKYFILFLITLTQLSYAGEKHVSMAAKMFYPSHQEQFVITLKNDLGWHTYWKNPGDAGLPVKFTFTLNGSPYDLSMSEWPVPKRYIEAGDILAYGYSDTYSFFFPLTASQISEFENSKMEIHGTWLVCKDICIPGEKRLTIDFGKNGAIKESTSEFSVSDEDLAEAIKKIPSFETLPQDFEIYLTNLKTPNKLRLHYSYKNLNIKDINLKNNLLTPELAPPLGFKKEKLFFDSANNTFYGYIDVDWDGEFTEPMVELPKDGAFKEPLTLKFLLQTKDKTITSNYVLKNFSLENETLTNFYKSLIPAIEIKEAKESSGNSFIMYILFAFLGGLILNLMPCVLPVISLKLFGLLNMREESKKQILKHNLAYTAGVLITFLFLAVSILILKKGGETVGWGFQLQSPSFVFFMLIVLLIMTLNFFGLFEFKTPGGSTLGAKKLSKSFWGDMGAGVIATILSTPCSAPFLGTALTFAFTTTSFNIIIIFLSIGLGLSFPFLLTGFFPRLISFLPKPGMWMEKLKYILGFTLLLTFVWLNDVLINLIDSSVFGIYINTIYILIFFAFFAAKKISNHKIIKVLMFVIPLLLTIQIINMGALKTSYVNDTNNNLTTNYSTGLVWESWSEEKMNQINNQPVFVDFTAKWCLTCKVNKKLVIETSDFKALVEKYNLKLLIADWTKRDENITRFLSKNEKVGVPAYFIRINGKLKDLGEVLTLQKVEEALKN